jgi:hypothetical protein
VSSDVPIIASVDFCVVGAGSACPFVEVRARVFAFAEA